MRQNDRDSKSLSKITAIGFAAIISLLVGSSGHYGTIFSSGDVQPVSSPVSLASSSSTSFFNLTMTMVQTFKISAPESSNISVFSISGGAYDVASLTTGGKSVFLFSPLEVSNYSLVINVSSVSITSSNYATLSVVGTPLAYLRNVNGTGNLLLSISIDVITQPSVQQSGGWNPLFGFTGISLGGITFDSTDLMIMFAAFSIALIVLGVRFTNKLLYAGIFFLFLIGVVEVGFLFVGAILAAYLVGFTMIRSYFTHRSKAPKKNL